MVSRKQNWLFPLGPVIKCLLLSDSSYGLDYQWPWSALSASVKQASKTREFVNEWERLPLHKYARVYSTNCNAAKIFCSRSDNWGEYGNKLCGANGRTQNAEPYSMEYPMEYLKWSTPKSHVLVK